MSVELFLAGAHAVVEAVSSRAVGARWDAPSVLEDQTVGVLSGHVARTGVMVVGDYLEGAAGAPTFADAADYYVTLLDDLGPDDHAAIRQRSAAVSAGGHAATADAVRSATEALEVRLPSVPLDTVIAVIGGARIRLGDYLLTRIVEQAVHLDDLARSVPDADVPIPPALAAAALDVGVEIGLRRLGGAAMLRSLFRGEPAPVL